MEMGKPLSFHTIIIVVHNIIYVTYCTHMSYPVHVWVANYVHGNLICIQVDHMCMRMQNSYYHLSVCSTV